MYNHLGDLKGDSPLPVYADLLSMICNSIVLRPYKLQDKQLKEILKALKDTTSSLVQLDVSLLNFINYFSQISFSNSLQICLLCFQISYYASWFHLLRSHFERKIVIFSIYEELHSLLLTFK